MSHQEPGAPEVAVSVAVSFAEVAAEDADVSVALEAEATRAVTGDPADPLGSDDPGDPAGEAAVAPSEDNTAPVEPAVTSMTGFGPVGDGDELRP